MRKLGGWEHLSAVLSGRSSTQVSTAEPGSFGDTQTDLGSSPAPPLCSWVSAQVQDFIGSWARRLLQQWACLCPGDPLPPYPWAALLCQLLVMLGVSVTLLNQIWQ